MATYPMEVSRSCVILLAFHPHGSPTALLRVIPAPAHQHQIPAQGVSSWRPWENEPISWGLRALHLGLGLWGVLSLAELHLASSQAEPLENQADLVRCLGKAPSLTKAGFKKKPTKLHELQSDPFKMSF